jgi:hypothetical protein
MGRPRIHRDALEAARAAAGKPGGLAGLAVLAVARVTLSSSAAPSPGVTEASSER